MIDNYWKIWTTVFSMNKSIGISVKSTNNFKKIFMLLQDVCNHYSLQVSFESLSVNCLL